MQEWWERHDGNVTLGRFSAFYKIQQIYRHLILSIWFGEARLKIILDVLQISIQILSHNELDDKSISKIQPNIYD